MLKQRLPYRWYVGIIVVLSLTHFAMYVLGWVLGLSARIPNG